MIDRFWRALEPRSAFVVDTRNRDQCVRSLPPEERMRRGSARIRVENEFDPTTSHWREVELFGGLEGTPFSLDARRLAGVARE